VTALQTVNGYSREVAENTYARGVNWTQEEIDKKMQQTFKQSPPLVGRSSL